MTEDGEAKHESGERRGLTPGEVHPKVIGICNHVCSIFERYLWFCRVFQVGEEIISNYVIKDLVPSPQYDPQNEALSWVLKAK